MGAWGTGVFENDSAMDWCDDFLEAPEGEGSDSNPGKVAFLIGAIQLVAEPVEDYVDVDDASAALAAAEIVAAIHGQPGAALLDPEEDPERAIAAWVAENDDAVLRRPEVRSLAIAAVERVRDDSELRELWAESEDADAWRASVEELIGRLSA